MALSDADADRVTTAVDVLAEEGLRLGFPQSSNIRGSRYALRELRIQSHSRALRVFYAFDPTRQAVVIIGGDKTSESDARFYRRYVPMAEELWEQYLAEIAEEAEDE